MSSVIAEGTLVVHCESRKKERGLLQPLIYCFLEVVSGIPPKEHTGWFTYEAPKVGVLLHGYVSATEQKLESRGFCSWQQWSRLPCVQALCACVCWEKDCMCVLGMVTNMPLAPMRLLTFLAACLYYPIKSIFIYHKLLLKSSAEFRDADRGHIFSEVTVWAF